MPRNKDLQDEVLDLSLSSPETFWAEQARHLDWHKKPSASLRRSKKTITSNGKSVTHDDWAWFPDGEISTCHNCLDRHVLAGNGRRPAIHYDSPVTRTKQTYTYAELLDEVQVLAGALKEMGVQKGDVVMLYSKPLSPDYTFSNQDRQAQCP